MRVIRLICGVESCGDSSLTFLERTLINGGIKSSNSFFVIAMATAPGICCVRRKRERERERERERRGELDRTLHVLRSTVLVCLNPL
jgi:hypothetical protein